MSAWHVFECLCMQWIFELPEMAKNKILDFLDPTCVSYGYFIQYFACKCSFREIFNDKNYNFGSK